MYETGRCCSWLSEAYGCHPAYVCRCCGVAEAEPNEFDSHGATVVPDTTRDRVRKDWLFVHGESQWKK